MRNTSRADSLEADTIVVLPPPSASILEKPRNIVDQYSMLQDYNGSTIQVITAVTLGPSSLARFALQR